MLKFFSAIGEFDKNKPLLETDKAKLDSKRKDCLKKLSSTLSLEEICQLATESDELDKAAQKLVLEYQKYLDRFKISGIAFCSNNPKNVQNSSIAELLQNAQDYFEHYFQKPLEADRIKIQNRIFETYLEKLKQVQACNKSNIWSLGSPQEVITQNTVTTLTKDEQKALQYFTDPLANQLIHHGVQIKNIPGIDEKQCFEISTLLNAISEHTKISPELFLQTIVKKKSDSNNLDKHTGTNTDPIKRNTVITLMKNVQPIDADAAKVFYAIVKDITVYDQHKLETTQEPAEFEPSMR